MESDVNETGPGIASDASEWNQRRLCSDESCIGVIGPQRRVAVGDERNPGGPSRVLVDFRIPDKHRLARCGLELRENLEQRVRERLRPLYVEGGDHKVKPVREAELVQQAVHRVGAVGGDGGFNFPRIQSSSATRCGSMVRCLRNPP